MTARRLPNAPLAPVVHDVAVVGLGPVGQVLALLLGRAGHSVVAVERRPPGAELSGAVHIGPESARVLRSAGVAGRVAEIAEPGPGHVECRNADGALLVRVPCTDAGGTVPGAGTGTEPGADLGEAALGPGCCRQGELETVLDEAIAALPRVTVRRGQEAVDVRESDDHVELTAMDQEGAEHTVLARYAVGADGANSFVRDRMPTPVTDLGFFYDWLLVDVLLHDERTRWPPVNLCLCAPERPTVLLPGGHGRRRFGFLRVPGEAAEELDTLYTVWALLKPWGRTPGNTTIERHAVHTVQARWADRWREGRLLLAGDAAHEIPPFAGDGLPSGLRDAANLAWKLGLVLDGTASPTLLDTYTTERHGHLRHALGVSMALGQAVCVLDPAEAAARDARMTAVHGDPDRALPPVPPPVLGDGVLQREPDGTPGPGAGHPAPLYRVGHGERTAPLDEFTGGGFAFLTDGQAPCDALDADDLDFLRGIGATLVPLRPAAPPRAAEDAAYRDTDDGYLSWLRARELRAAVLRPDSVVFGGAATPAGLHGLVGQLREQLQHRPVLRTPQRTR